MVVLVTYASAHGSTKGVARRIGERLVTCGLETEVRATLTMSPLSSATKPSSSAAPCTTTPGCQHPRASFGTTPQRWRLGRRGCSVWARWGHQQLLRSPRRTPDGPPAGTRRQARGRARRGLLRTRSPELRRRDRTRPLGAVGNVFLRAVGGSFGDHRDWADIDAWADEIGGAPPERAARPGPDGEAETACSPADIADGCCCRPSSITSNRKVAAGSVNDRLRTLAPTMATNGTPIGGDAVGVHPVGGHPVVGDRRTAGGRRRRPVGDRGERATGRSLRGREDGRGTRHRCGGDRVGGRRQRSGAEGVLGPDPEVVRRPVRQAGHRGARGGAGER